MSTANAIYLIADGHRVALDLDSDTQLLPSFQANDRTKPDSIQSDYSPEFSVPGTAHNHRVLKFAAASQPVTGQAYKRVPAVLTSGGVETLPLALLYLKGYSEGRYNLQLFGGNKRLVEALGDKKLSDLDLSRFDHDWTPENILAGLPFEYWAANGWGYEPIERGKPLDLQNLDPYGLYPSCSANLVWTQMLTDAGFTADSLLKEPLWAALNVPSANPFTFSQDFREARQLKAGLAYNPIPLTTDITDVRKVCVGHEGEFPAEKLPFNYTEATPFAGPTAGATFTGSTYTADALGYYNLNGTAAVRYGCRPEFPGQVSCKVLIYINGQPVYDALGNQIGVDEHRIRSNGETDGGSGYLTRKFTPKLEKYLLKPGDKVELWWQGDEWETFNFGPTDPYWQLGPVKDASKPIHLPDGRDLLTSAQFSVELLPAFPPTGRVKLNEWLPDIKQADFFLAIMLIMGLTVQTDAYEPHLKLSPGSRLLQNISSALDWSNKRDAAHRPGRLQEREVAYRFGSYAKTNLLQWTEDERVSKGYANGSIEIADEVLGDSFELATLPFAATQDSPQSPGLLQILNFEASDLTTTPPTYSDVTAQPRIVLRSSDLEVAGRLITMPADETTGQQQVVAPFTSTASYFTSADLSLELNKTVLTEYWQDLRAMLTETRFIREKIRLTARDIAELDFSRPVWLGLGLDDYYAISRVVEFDARRSTTVELVRIHSTHLPPPRLPSGAGEFYKEEWYGGEFY